MRPSDEAALRVPYGPAADPQTAFDTALGVPCPRITELGNEISGDLDSTSFGVGWWQHLALDRQRRILISDYLLAAVRTTHTNLIEAKLHLLEAITSWECITTAIQANARVGRSGPPKPEAAIDELPSLLGPLHVVGAVRALASAIDCLAASIIGVVALPTSIILADWPTLRKVKPTGAGPGLVLQDGLLRTLWAQEGAAGPTGWLDWLLSFRNMLVHRARRFVTYNVRTYGSGRLAVPGAKAVVADYLLPRDPKRSDVDVWRAMGASAGLLTEPARQTLEGAESSVLKLCEMVAAELLEVWRRRRATPGLLEQPKAQWPSESASPIAPFAGYSPGTSPVSPVILQGNPEMAARIAAAGVTTANRPIVWP